MAMKLIALVVLVFLGKSDAKEEMENSLDRQGFSLSTNCENSEPFFIKNEKKRQPYLTADPETNAVKAWAKTGEANQQWMWSRCDYAVHLKNVATGGCLTTEGVLSECRDNIFWEHYDDGGTLSFWGQVEKDDGFGVYSESVLDLLASSKERLHCRLLKRSSTK